MIYLPLSKQKTKKVMSSTSKYLKSVIIKSALLDIYILKKRGDFAFDFHPN